jgi:AcrR family transcriptional regulator
VSADTTSQLVGVGIGSGRETPLPVAPKQARGVVKRDRLYDASIARFARDGVAETRVEDVIADAGVSWATFFRYFPRKEDVLIAAAARHFRDHVKAPARAALADRRRSVRRSIEATFEALSTPVELPPALHAAAMLEVTGHPTRFAALVADGSIQPMIELVAELIAEGQARGEIRDDHPPATIAVTVVAGAYYPGVQAAAMGADASAAMKLGLELIWGGIGSS